MNDILKEYKNYLQNAYGDKYHFVSEEKVDYDFNKEKNLVILSQIGGENYTSSMTFSIQALVLTNDVEETMIDLTNKNFMYSNKIVQTKIFPFIKQQITPPVNNTNFGQFNENYIGTIMFTLNLINCINGVDVDKVYIDDSLIEITQGTLGYAGLTDTQRTNQDEINTTNINESTLNLVLTFPSQKSSFFNKLRNVFFGVLPKNTDFKIKIVFSDGYEYEYENFKIASDSLMFERASLMINTATFVR